MQTSENEESETGESENEVLEDEAFENKVSENEVLNINTSETVACRPVRTRAIAALSQDTLYMTLSHIWGTKKDNHEYTGFLRRDFIIAIIANIPRCN